MKRYALLVTLATGALFAQTSLPSGAELAQSIRSATLDAGQCYRVRDLAFARDEIKLFLNDGILIFTKPVEGERIGAIFASDDEPADGELLLLPPNREERTSMAKFTRTPNLDEHFSAALLTFTDNTARDLMTEIAAGRGRPAGEACAQLAEQWDPIVANLTGSLAQRIAGDLLAPSRPGGGFLFVSLQSVRLGNFDVMFDPLADDQIVAGKLAEHSGYWAYDVWTSFPARSVRTGAAPAYDPPFRVTSYSIKATLDDSLALKATTRATLQVGTTPSRAITLGISRAEQVTAARLDGAPVELLYQESDRSRALRANENDLFLVVAKEMLQPGSTHELELDHAGEVIADRGAGVYSVGARTNWYPRLALEFAGYETEFRYPKDLTLVSPGDVIEDRVEGEEHITRRRTAGPIRLAGFNLGHYALSSKKVDGLTVDVYGNRGLDPALAPKPRATIIPQPVRPLYRGQPTSSTGTTTVIQTPAAPDPLGRLDAVAADMSQALQFYSNLFGQPPLRTLTVSPIPGTTGQGFPGLIYLSTLSYIEESQRPENTRDARTKVFFSDLMVAHEVAHQWWGNIVATTNYQDEWITEGLAHYSALLWLEKKRGVAAMQTELNEFRTDLLMSSIDGGTVESYGPLSWGYRLEASRDTETWRVITYEKGAWVFHMLRQRLGDAKFFALLSQLRKRYEYRSVTTRDLRNLVKEVGAPAWKADAVDAFFDSWVHSTGIPSVRVRYSTTGRAPSVRVTGTVVYEDSSSRGVHEDFMTELPFEVTLANGTRRIEWVKTEDGTQPFSFTLPQAPTKIELLSNATLATSR
ncbi:MAG: hypothetical protein RL328_1309 [Acidobacteriota bacterium]